MPKLEIEMKNCYGIGSLKKDFMFGEGLKSTCAIYAPNGFMKTSFAKSFDDYARGESPKEERFGKESFIDLRWKGERLSEDSVYVLKSSMSGAANVDSVTNILVDPASKERYDEIFTSLDKKKSAIVKELQKKSKIKNKDVEHRLVEDFGVKSFPEAIRLALEEEVDLPLYQYEDVFDEKVVDVVDDDNFQRKIIDFIERYNQIFDDSQGLYKKGVFNPTKAESSIATLEKSGFFDAGHTVNIEDSFRGLGLAEIKEKIEISNKLINEDEHLKDIKKNLSRNVKSQFLEGLIESQSITELHDFLDLMKVENRHSFKKRLWAQYVKESSIVREYVDQFEQCEEELKSIEEDASSAVTGWRNAVDLFNSRFVDMPFRLIVENYTNVVLGVESAVLKFRFEQGDDKKDFDADSVGRSLSQGEARALYILNFIFEVESRKLNGQETVFVIDDMADSFDYKNKHAILQYLSDLASCKLFRQIILTHNFDFFRAMSSSRVCHRDNCLVSCRDSDSKISFEKAEGVQNYFVNILKKNFEDCDLTMCSTIPFSRNIIEYTEGESDKYLSLTSLLHWKRETESISVGDYVRIYNSVFGENHDESRGESLCEVILKSCELACDSPVQEGFNLEQKIVLSMGIRLLSEKYLTNELRRIRSDSDFWCEGDNQFGKLFSEYKKFDPPSESVRVIERVSVIVSSNIHLNSFMYEPIVDLGINHLVDLYGKVRILNV